MKDRVVRRPRRLLAIGYQGFGNLGDEAILTGIEAILADGRATVGAIVCGPEPASVAGFPSARRIPSPRLLPTLQGLRALWASDGLLLTGGGLMHDHWPTVIPRYLAWIVLARGLGKRVAWVGVGVGPIRRPWQRALAKLSRRLTTLALVRDVASAHLVGGVGEQLEVVPDPAFFNVRPRRRASSDQPGELAIIIRGPTPAHQDLAEPLAATLIGACELAARDGWQPVLLTMAGPADDAFADLVRLRGLRRGMAITTTPLAATPAAALVRLAACRAVISVRLHGVILSALAGVPCVPIAYDAKVRDAADQLGMRDLVVDQEDVTAELLLAHVADASTPDRRARVEERVRLMRDQHPRVANRLARAMGAAR